MAATMKIQIYLANFLFSFIILSSESIAELFPQTGGDELQRSEDTTNHELKLPNGIEFPFRGSRYKSLYISKDGLVGFHPSTVYRAEDFTTTLTKEDPAFVAPFFYPGQVIGSNVGGKVYTGKVLFRAGPGTGPNSIGVQELGNYSSITEQSVIGLHHFNATFGLVVTWKEVISRKDVEDGCDNNQRPCANNTFQLAMLTDGSKSFAIFNYINMRIQPGTYYQSGFNAGEGRGYTTALDKYALSMAQSSYGSDVLGRYIYRIDTEQIIRGGCVNSPQSQGSLNIYPTFAGMLGGKMIDLSGPCMLTDNPNLIIKCRFGGLDTLVTNGYKVNKMRARCYVPKMPLRGWIKIEMSINNGVTYQYETTILIVHPDRVPNDEVLGLPYNGHNTGWNETNPQTLTVTWNGGKLTTEQNVRVEISLWGYRETRSDIVWQILASGIGNPLARDEKFSFQSDQIKCNGPECENFEIGFVVVEIQDLHQANSHKYLVSRTLPLGFYMNNAMQLKYGDNWPNQKCKAWYDKDREHMDWLSKLQHCPCNLVQALSDIGRWQTDVGCNLYDGSKCRFHIGAVHCVRSVEPSPDGAGNQCCYDKAGNLKFAADSYQGSTPDRSHTWGALPYNMVGHVPGNSHWILDVVTFYYCCLWTDYNGCDYYMDQRATRDCVGYTPPTPAMLYGQGHFETFDGKHGRMCADGDFILMNATTDTGNIVVQGRFYQNVFGERGNTSVMLTNVAVQVQDDTVEIRLKLPTTDRSRRHLDVLVNKNYYFFEDTQSYWQDFKNLAVVNTDEHGMESNFTIILHNGLGVQIADCNMTLCVLIMAPSSLMGKVQGLLGNFNGNASDDFLSTNITINTQVANGLHLNYAQQYQTYMYKWAVNQNSIIPMNVKPEYNAPVCNLQPPDRTTQACQNNPECLFDYSATGDQKIAIQTLSISNRLKELRSFVKPERTCGLLDVPKSTKSNINYKLGSTVTITGCRVGTMQGDDFTYTCTETSSNTQHWSPTVTAKCSSDVDVADTAMIVGIVVGVLVLIVILIIVGVVVRKFRKTSRKDSSDKYGPSENPIAAGLNDYGDGNIETRELDRIPKDKNELESKEYSL